MAEAMAMPSPVMPAALVVMTFSPSTGHLPEVWYCWRISTFAEKPPVVMMTPLLACRVSSEPSGLVALTPTTRPVSSWMSASPLVLTRTLSSPTAFMNALM